MLFMRARWLAIALTLFFVVGCGGKREKNGPKKVEPCGNGALDLAEKCDKGIESGAGSCPTECPSAGNCNGFDLVGAAISCTAECIPRLATCGTDDDQCCPAGCDVDADNDCTPASLCGNGVLDGAETCDPSIPSGRTGACECPSSNAMCSQTVLRGSPALCDIQCVTEPITTCDFGDGCCPAGCAAQGDADCPTTCGNGIIEAGEQCDGNCPSFCDDGDACTTETLNGDPSTCDAFCDTRQVTSCTNSDGCCPAGCSPAVDNDCVAVCGNGIVEFGELCDGNCPAACNDGNACTTDSLVGSAANCDAECSTMQITACINGDGCCPAMCNDLNDADCGAICGNGIVEAPETCDGNCPAICNDGNACTNDVRSGSNALCNVSCSFNPVNSCINNDGCCPPACNAGNDNDCSASCGNGIVEGSETCDGNCPSSCFDGVVCTADVLSGSAASCTAMCQFPAITACTDGDGCCPSSCVFATDNDCACIPNTCASLGLTCGTLADDGCGGGGEVCGACMAGRTCVANQCQLDFDVADPCLSNGDCAGAAGVCITQLTSGWDNGYCTRACAADADCGVPNHCGSDGFCWKSCVDSTECRTGYMCFDDDGDGLNECAPAATGTGAVGAACTRFGDCSGGAAGWCATEASQFRGGFCSRDCASNADCPAGSHCYAGQACVPNCVTAATCRGNGYDCYDADGDTSLECFRFANGAGTVGASCTGLWNCAGGQWGWCKLPSDGYNGGYCTAFCGGGQSVCPSGSSCWSGAAESICLDQCQNVNQCRAGYVCDDPGGAGRTLCNPQ